MQVAQWSAIAMLLVTAYIAWQNTRSVKVVERSLVASQIPRFGVQVLFGLEGVGARVTNVGQGPALDARLKLTYIPCEGSSREPFSKAWRLGVAERGRKIDVPGPLDNGDAMDPRTFFACFKQLRLTGEAWDSLGNRHEVNEVLDDVQSFSEVRQGVELHPKSGLEQSIESLTHELAYARIELKDHFDSRDEVDAEPPF